MTFDLNRCAFITFPPDGITTQRKSIINVVNTSSGTHHKCALPFSYAPKFIKDLFVVPQNPGCVDEDFLKNGMLTPTYDAAYIQAKIANIMHVVEISRNHKQSTAIAIDLGWVRTSILWFMRSIPAGWMRDVNVGVLPVLHAILSSEEDLINAMGRQQGWSEGGIMMNVFGRPEEAFSYPWWTSEGAGGHDIGRRRMMELGSKLWTTSENIFKENDYLD